MDDMDWYLRQESNDRAVPSDQESIETLFLKDTSVPVNHGWQFESVKSQRFNPSKNYCGSPREPTMEEISLNKSRYFQVNASSHEDEGSSNSSACGSLLTVSSGRALEASLEGRTDFQQQNSMEQMNDIFMNSLLEEELRNMENPFESLQMFPETMYSSLSFENLWTDMVIDPRSLVKDPARKESSACIKANSYVHLDSGISEDWDKVEDSSPSCSMPEEIDRSEDLPLDAVVTTLVPAELSASNESDAVSGEDEPMSMEATVLQEFEDVMIQLNKKVRICFRDALYRLARSSKQQKTVKENANADQYTVAGINCDNFRLGRSKCCESKTNAIDRMVANLMFAKPYCDLGDLYCPTISSQRCKENPAGSGAHQSLDQLSLLPPTQAAHSTEVSSNSDHLTNGFSSREPATVAGYILEINSHKNMYPGDINDQFSMS